VSNGVRLSPTVRFRRPPNQRKPKSYEIWLKLSQERLTRHSARDGVTQVTRPERTIKKMMPTTDREASRDEACQTSRRAISPRETVSENLRTSYYRARYYDPAAGRFLGEDPLQFGGDGADFYAYVDNSPTDFTDLLGLSMEAAKSGLCEISRKKFSGPCRKFLEKLANAAGTSVDALISQLQATASSAQNYLYDGPSSSVPLDENKFPGASSAGATTVGQTFEDSPGQLALSQKNGAAIFLRSGDWGSGPLAGIFSPFANSDGSATSYGLGVLTHELLHKLSVGGGFSHGDMKAALNSVGAPGSTLGREDIADRIGRLCFQGGTK